MHNFYLHIPWIIDETEYNCSSRTLDEWYARGSVNPKQCAYFLLTGTIFITVYILSMVGMYRAKLLHIPCYRLMFFNGFIDIFDVMLGSHIVSYFHFTGSVYCTNPGFNLVVGHSVWSTWLAASVMCVALATNRVVEMIPSMNKCRFIFQGRKVYIWMAISVTVWIVRPFLFRALLYNSREAAFLYAPFISDNVQWENDFYTPLFVAIHNILFPVVLILLYLILCIYVLKIKGFTNGRLDKTQLQLFLQSIVICSSTSAASLLYFLIQLVSVPKAICIFSNVIWQLSHGIHGVVYMIVNKKIREEVLKLLGLKRNVGAISVTTLVASNRKDETIAHRKK